MAAATMEHPGLVFDRLVESASKMAASKQSEKKPFGLTVLRLKQEPIRRHLPRVERDISKISQALRQAIRSCVCGESPWPLVLCGSAGTGKTCAALCLLDYADDFLTEKYNPTWREGQPKEYIPSRPSSYFVVGDLCEKLNMATMGRFFLPNGGDAITPERFRKIYLDDPPLVVLDELGLRENISDAHYESVYRAIELRYCKPFVVISNHGLDKIEKIYDARTASRLGAGTVLEISGADRRLQ